MSADREYDAVEQAVLDATSQLLIELAFVVPRGTDLAPTSPVGRALVAFRLDAAAQIDEPRELKR